jgi:hypothetical protein
MPAMRSQDVVIYDPRTLRDLFAALINGYTELSRPNENEELKASAEQGKQFLELIARFVEAHERDRQRQADTADDFNILEVIRLTYKEGLHSDVLAWVLDHDMDNLGTHAQGALGFRLFLKEFGLPEQYARSANYWVKREVAGDESIVDIEVGAKGEFLIHIENKILANEGKDQTVREWADLKRRARDLGVNVDDVHPLFLTPSGDKPLSDCFRPISWGQVVSVFTAFAEKARPPEVKLFASHYAKAVERFVAAKRQEDREDHVENLVERGGVAIARQMEISPPSGALDGAGARKVQRAVCAG